MARIARFGVVGPDQYFSSGDDGGGIAFGAEVGGPFNIFSGIGIEGVGQVVLPGDHIAGKAFAPLGLITGMTYGREKQEQEKRVFFHITIRFSIYGLRLC